MGRVMAIDFGTRRVGIALSDILQLTAHGLETISWNGEDSQFLLDRLATIVKDKDVTEIVIGQPKRTDGGVSTSLEKALLLGEAVFLKTGLKPIFQDERYTTVLASRFLLETGVSGKNKKNVIDQVAAEIILREYLESHRMDK